MSDAVVPNRKSCSMLDLLSYIMTQASQPYGTTIRNCDQLDGKACRLCQQNFWHNLANRFIAGLSKFSTASIILLLWLSRNEKVTQFRFKFCFCLFRFGNCWINCWINGWLVGVMFWCFSVSGPAFTARLSSVPSSHLNLQNEFSQNSTHLSLICLGICILLTHKKNCGW